MTHKQGKSLEFAAKKRIKAIISVWVLATSMEFSAKNCTEDLGFLRKIGSGTKKRWNLRRSESGLETNLRLLGPTLLERMKMHQQ